MTNEDARYVPALDGLRAVAVLTVVAHHVGLPYAAGGYIGVDIFFVLSGYLITRNLLAEQAASQRIAIGRFYLRRMLRLAPALCTMLLCVGLLLAAGVLRVAPGAGPWWTTAALSSLYLSDIVAALRAASLDPFGHTWSLAIEEQFYVVWPLAVLALRHVARPALVTGLAATGSAALLLATAPAHPVAAYVLPVTHGLGLLAGCALAMTTPAVRTEAARHAGLAATALILVVTLFPADFDAVRAIGVLLATVATVPIVSFLVVRPTSAASQLLSSPIPRWLGRCSYALYLWHYPLIFGLRRAHPAAPAYLPELSGAALSLVAAALSLHFVERPCLRLKARLLPSPTPDTTDRSR